jgi:DNA-nicking Smr family endonuclease
VNEHPRKENDRCHGDPSPGEAAEVAAFERAMADVVRLPPDPRGRVHAQAAPNTPNTTLGRPSVTASPEDLLDQADEAFAAAGVDRRELRKLKRGDYVAAGRRDLHGMTVAAAVASVARFLELSRHQQHRCVCIVHGRGLHSAGNTAILKTRVREYLRSHRSVLAYADAPRSDGGAGAVYVLLRKRE